MTFVLLIGTYVRVVPETFTILDESIFIFFSIEYYKTLKCRLL